MARTHVCTLPAGRGTPAALVIGHPGHELRLHGWLEAARPRCFVLTDGSGHRGQPRLDVSSRVLTRAGCPVGTIFGRFSDVSFYNALLDRDFAVFLALAEELAVAFMEDEVGYVVGDAVEGYNPCHDVCRLVVDAAVALASRRRGCAIASFDFLLVGRPDACPPDIRDQAIWMYLDDRALARKLQTAQRYRGLTDEVHDALDRLGSDSFRVECLRPAQRCNPCSLWQSERPHYERHGERQVARGLYQRVLRYRKHIMPLAHALHRLATRRLLAEPCVAEGARGSPAT